MRPSSAVTSSHSLPCFMSPRCTAASARPIARLDMSKSNVLNDVNGIFRISCGYGPVRLLPLYTRYVEISEPKSKHSEPMNAQNAILRLSSPMLVRCVAAAMVMSSLEGLERPAEDAEQDDRGAHERERQPVGEWREREDWQAQRRDERPDRPTRHMDLGELGAFGDGLELGLGPARQAARDRRNHVEVVDRRRRRDGPFERGAAPRIVAGGLPTRAGAPDVPDEHQHAHADQERAGGRDEVG